MKSKLKLSIIIGFIFTLSLILNEKAYGQTESEIWVKDGTTNNIYYNGVGNVGIGTRNPQEKLTVNGRILAKEVTVDLEVIPDFVFEEDYKLKSLEEIENYIKEYKHLPEIPSASEVKEKGLKSGEMQAKLLQKIEELTLHMIAMKKKNIELQKEISKLKIK